MHMLFDLVLLSNVIPQSVRAKCDKHVSGLSGFKENSEWYPSPNAIVFSIAFFEIWNFPSFGLCHLVEREWFGFQDPLNDEARRD